MIAALRALRTKRTLILFLIGALVLGIALSWAYSKALSRSYAKLEPYALSFTIQRSPKPLDLPSTENRASAEDRASTKSINLADTTITMAYDYGYGITKNHKRLLKLKPSESEKIFEISLSAWKKIHELHFIGPKNSGYKLINLTIGRSDNIHDLSHAELVPINQGNNITYRLPLNAWAH